MLNFEKYYDRLSENNRTSITCKAFYLMHPERDNCIGVGCEACREAVKKWLLEEYKPQIDWSKVPVDTPVIVSNGGGFFKNRHFAGFNAKNDRCFATFAEGRTSFTANGALEHWLKCELARPEDIEKYSI